MQSRVTNDEAMTAQIASESERNLGEFVIRIKRRHLVALGERGIVEDIVHKEVERSPKRHRRLPNVNQFGCACAEQMHAEYGPIVRVHEELYQTVGVANDLPARDFTVTGHANLVRDASLAEFLFRLPYHRRFRDCVDSVWKEV